MGRRGPEPEDREVLEARGSKRARDRQTEGDIALVAPKKPDWLGDRAAQIWRARVKELMEQGTLHKTDQDLLGRYCDQQALYEGASAVVSELGPSMERPTKDGHVLLMNRPEMDIILKLNTTLLQMAKELGLSPRSRKELGLRAQKKNAPAAGENVRSLEAFRQR